MLSAVWTGNGRHLVWLWYGVAVSRMNRICGVRARAPVVSMFILITLRSKIFVFCLLYYSVVLRAAVLAKTFAPSISVIALNGRASDFLQIAEQTTCFHAAVGSSRLPRQNAPNTSSCRWSVFRPFQTRKIPRLFPSANGHGTDPVTVIVLVPYCLFATMVSDFVFFLSINNNYGLHLFHRIQYYQIFNWLNVFYLTFVGFNINGE